MFLLISLFAAWCKEYVKRDERALGKRPKKNQENACQTEMAEATTSSGTDDRRAKALSDYRKKLLEHREIEAKVKECKLCFFHPSVSFVNSSFLIFMWTYIKYMCMSCSATGIEIIGQGV
jgi:hypothetical protein